MLLDRTYLPREGGVESDNVSVAKTGYVKGKYSASPAIFVLIRKNKLCSQPNIVH